MTFKVHVYALILFDHEDKILLRRKKDSHFYYLPGAEVTLGQAAEKCLREYLSHQLKFIPSSIFFVGTMEEISVDEHNYALFFKVSRSKDALSLPEDDFVYEWKALPLSRDIELDPSYLKEDLSRWLKGKAIFLSTEDKAFSS